MKTKKEERKKIKIFISHSQKDKVVAMEFKKMFEVFEKLYPGKQDVFLSSDLSSEQIKTGQWKTDFEEHLKASTHFVVLVTPNSLNSTWVTYEIGYALALGIEIIPIGIRGASPEAFFLNSYNIQIVKEEQDVIKLLNRIFGSTEKFNKIWCIENEEIIGKLLAHCKNRCAYFVGSVPLNESKEEVWDDNNKDFVKNFVQKLTEKLLKSGIKVSSFPTVPYIGEEVFDIARNPPIVGKDKSPMDDEEDMSSKYEIAGLYRFDEIAKEKNIKPETWRKTLDDFRRLYLKNKSSMIIIGGNEHTEEEYEVAETFDHLEIFPIRCMGGFAAKKFDEKIEKFKKIDHPCSKCKDYMTITKTECKFIDAFVDRLGKYIHVDHDERKS